MVLVGLPDYFGSFKTNFERLYLLNHLKRLCEDYPNTVVHNYNRPRLFPLMESNLFLDGGWGMTNSHLSSEGAKLLCKKLADDIRGYYQ